MSGHSKWHNIRVKKQKMDAQRGKTFTRLSREIMLAVREGGADPDYNYRLSAAIAKAKEMNMPSSNIERAIERATGGPGGEGLEEITLEGYGPNGVAIMVNAVTDNRNRTIPEIRNIFSKHGGSLGEAGCVSWIFEKKGIITVKVEDTGEYELMEAALKGGAEDMSREGNLFQVTTEPSNFMAVKERLKEEEIPMESADITMIPKNEVKLDGAQAKSTLNLMEDLENHDDVQDVYANFDIPDEIMARMGS